MMLRQWFTDTIARRFALTVFFVALVTLILLYLFSLLVGPLARQPLTESGLLPEAADLVAMIEAAPPELRPSSTSAITNSAHRVHWLTAGSDGARVLGASQHDDTEGTARGTVAALTQRRVVVLEPAGKAAWPAALRLDGESTPLYMLGVQLRDRSWVVFTLAHRSWGMQEQYDRTTLASARGVLDGPDSVTAMKRFQSWFQHRWAKPADHHSDFEQGKAALSWSGHWFYFIFSQALGRDLVLMPLPDLGTGTKTGMGSWSWAISSTCPYPAEAWRFLAQLMTVEEILRVTNRNAGMPARRSARARSTLYGKDGPLSVFAQQLDAGHGVPRPQTPAYEIIRNSFRTADHRRCRSHASDPAAAGFRAPAGRHGLCEPGS